MKSPKSNLFVKPLIVGASISADWAASSPGKRLSSRFTEPSEIRIIARGGQTGAAQLRSVTPAVLADRSIVIGFDLFFWDSARGPLSESVAALKKLVLDTRELNLPLVIGDIPELLPGRQPNRKELNQMIRRAGRANAHVFVVPLEELYLRILKDQKLEIGGKEYGFFDLVPDGLHIGDVAADFLADVILETLTSGERPEISR